MKKTLIIILILILPLVALAADLFSDGFESGDLTAWDDSDINGGDLSAHADAKLHGNYGLNCLYDDTNNMYVRDNTPSSEARYRARFYFDPNGLSMTAQDIFVLFQIFSSGAAGVCKVYFKFTGGSEYMVRASIRDDADTWVDIDKVGLTDEPHCIEIDWQASSSDGADDGSLQLWIDEISIGSQTGIDNDTRNVDFLYLGAREKDAGTSGTFFLDDFASNDDGSEIGMISVEEANSIMFGCNF